MVSDVFVWRDKELKTVGDLYDAMDALASPEEAQEFIKAYRESDPGVADQNAGYTTGYFDNERAQELREWMQVEHPIFGTKTPTMLEAFKAGEEVAKRFNRMREQEENVSR